MLRSLGMKNLVLVEEATVDFKEGLTIITGETGAGKTALIEALRLVLGERADSSKVRKGCERASVYAVFDPSPALLPLIQEAGIDYNSTEELILKREILSSGKSRAFFCGEPVSATFLQTVAPFLVDFIGQHAQVLLKSSEQQLSLLDQYGQIDPTPFRFAWNEEKDLEKGYELLLAFKASSERRKAQLEAQKEELEEANVQEGDDESLFEEYTLLSNAQELLLHSSAVLSASEEATEKCRQIEKNLQGMLRFDKSLEEGIKMGKEAHFQLCELIQFVQSFQSKMESDPGRLAFLEERLKVFDRLKKKYGKDLVGFLNSLEEELKRIENLDDQIKEMQQKLQGVKKTSAEEVKKLRKKRSEAAQTLASALASSLRELNIPQAEVSILLTPCSRNAHGEDAAAFYLRANAGEQSAPVKESSSGGELSRLLFSLKLLLSNQAPTLIFDEIDANVGGETATIIGKKLKMLGNERQIFCITHFPQVAKQADHHLSVVKKEIEGRTRTEILPLDDKTRETEILRMLGGEAVKA